MLIFFAFGVISVECIQINEIQEYCRYKQEMYYHFAHLVIINHDK